MAMPSKPGSGHVLYRIMISMSSSDYGQVGFANYGYAAGPEGLGNCPRTCGVIYTGRCHAELTGVLVWKKEHGYGS